MRLACAVCALLIGCQTAPPPQSASSLGSVEGAPPLGFVVQCADAEGCPAYVGLLVAQTAAPEPIRCTATLVTPGQVLTAAHCVRDVAPRGAMWVGFPEAPPLHAEWVRADRIVERSPTPPTDDVIHADFAVLSLHRPLRRPPLRYMAQAPAPGSVLRMIAVTADQFYDHVHHVDARNCLVADPKRAEAAFGNRAFSVGWLSQCPIREGNSGSPLIDEQGRLAGLVNGGTPPFFAVGVMTRTFNLGASSLP